MTEPRAERENGWDFGDKWGDSEPTDGDHTDFGAMAAGRHEALSRLVWPEDGPGKFLDYPAPYTVLPEKVIPPPLSTGPASGGEYSTRFPEGYDFPDLITQIPTDRWPRLYQAFRLGAEGTESTDLIPGPDAAEQPIQHDNGEQ